MDTSAATSYFRDFGAARGVVPADALAAVFDDAFAGIDMAPGEDAVAVHGRFLDFVGRVGLGCWFGGHEGSGGERSAVREWHPYHYGTFSAPVPHMSCRPPKKRRPGLTPVRPAITCGVIAGRTVFPENRFRHLDAHTTGEDHGTRTDPRPPVPVHLERAWRACSRSTPPTSTR